MLFFLFVVFEACCGVYFPALATLRGELLPEAHRAGIMVRAVPCHARSLLSLSLADAGRERDPDVTPRLNRNAQNWVRVPLNCNVVVMLLLLNWMTHHHLFAVSALFCGIALVAHRHLAADLAHDALVEKQRLAHQSPATPARQLSAARAGPDGLSKAPGGTARTGLAHPLCVACVGRARRPVAQVRSLAPNLSSLSLKNYTYCCRPSADRWPAPQAPRKLDPYLVDDTARMRHTVATRAPLGEGSNRAPGSGLDLSSLRQFFLAGNEQPRMDADER